MIMLAVAAGYLFIVFTSFITLLHALNCQTKPCLCQKVAAAVEVYDKLYVESTKARALLDGIENTEV